MLLKTFIAVDLIAVGSFDAAANRLILLAAALAALGALWRLLLRPAGGIIRHAASIVRRTAEAVEHLEHLPERWAEQAAHWRAQAERDTAVDERIADAEAELGIVHNDVAAIRRKLGVTDDEVRSDVRERRG